LQCGHVFFEIIFLLHNFQPLSTPVVDAALHVVDFEAFGFHVFGCRIAAPSASAVDVVSF
jgi:hypothetical protein